MHVILFVRKSCNVFYFFLFFNSKRVWLDMRKLVNRLMDGSIVWFELWSIWWRPSWWHFRWLGSCPQFKWDQAVLYNITELRYVNMEKVNEEKRKNRHFAVCFMFCWSRQKWKLRPYSLSVTTHHRQVHTSHVNNLTYETYASRKRTHQTPPRPRLNMLAQEMTKVAFFQTKKGNYFAVSSFSG